jgi:hypothetical protein
MQLLGAKVECNNLKIVDQAYIQRYPHVKVKEIGLAGYKEF